MMLRIIALLLIDRASFPWVCVEITCSRQHDTTEKHSMHVLSII